jgi:hypothetical protein
MAIKKTELYSSLWASCDELRGGMDAEIAALEDHRAIPRPSNKARGKNYSLGRHGWYE